MNPLGLARAFPATALYRSSCIHYPTNLCGMSKNGFHPKAIEGLAALGFAVGSTRGVVRVEKYGCGAEFRKGTDGLYQMTVMPTIMVKGQFTRLWDAGYQKFLLTDDGQKIPALAAPPAEFAQVQRRTAHGVGRTNVLQRGAWLGESNLGVRSRQRPKGRRAGRYRRVRMAAGAGTRRSGMTRLCGQSGTCELRLAPV